MSLYKKEELPDIGITYAIWKIEEGEEELTSPLPDGDTLLQQARRCFKAVRRRLEWLSVRRLFHELGYKHTDIMYYPTGRPYMASQTVHISISHTNGYAAVALSPNTPVGIDIEQMGEKVRRVSAKFLSDEELASIATGDNEIPNLLIHWSAKETMFKLLDQEGIDFSEHLRIYPYSMSDAGFIQGKEFYTDKEQHYCIYYRRFSDFVLTISKGSKNPFKF